MKLRLTTVEATHIGNGETAYPFEFIEYEKNIYRIDYFKELNNLMVRFPEKEGSLKSFIDFFSNSVLQQIKESEFSRLSLKQLFLQISLTENDYSNYVGELISTKRYITKLLKSKIPKGLVNLHVRDGNGVAYIPGSSIKGSYITKCYKTYLQENIDKPLLEDFFIEQEVDRNRKPFFKLVDSVSDWNDFSDKGLQNYSSFLMCSDFTSEKNYLLKIIKPELLTTKKQDSLNYYEVTNDNKDFLGDISVDIIKLKEFCKSNKLQKNAQTLKILFGLSVDDLKKDNDEIISIFDKHVYSIFKKNCIDYVNKDLAWINKTNEIYNEDDYSEDFKSLKKFHLSLVEDIKAGLTFTKIGWASQLHGITFFPELINWFNKLEEGNLKEKVRKELHFIVSKKVQPIRNKKIQIDDNYIIHLPHSRRILSELIERELVNTYLGWYQVNFILN